MAVANSLSPFISVLLGDGHGGFSAATNVPLGQSPYSITITDLNGDGKADLIAAIPSPSRLAVLLGNGLGGFGPPAFFTTGDYPYSVAVGDCNRDGRPDVALAEPTSNGVLVLTNQGPGSTAFAFCYGGGSAEEHCPCGNNGFFGHGCQNSSATGGALLSATGSASPDTVVLTSSSELPSVPSVFVQGTASIQPVSFGDGLRCIASHLERLYVKSASAGSASAPQAGDPSITARSAALGDPIAPGSMRFYQVYYRDPVLSFCPPPAGNSWNVGNAIAIAW